MSRVYIQEGGLLNMPAKRRGLPRSATQNVPLLSASLPPQHFPGQPRPGSVWPKFPFAPAVITEIIFLPNFRTGGLGAPLITFFIYFPLIQVE
jgi:hypothetical protein